MVTERTLPPRSIDITLEGMRRFSGPGKNIHTDREAAREIGVSEPIAAGAMLQGFISGWLFSEFGESWYADGRLEITFVDMVLPGDTFVIEGTARGDGDDGTEIDVECRVPDEEGGDDRTAVVATATIGGA